MHDIDRSTRALNVPAWGRWVGAGLAAATVLVLAATAWVWTSTEAALERERVDRITDRGSETVAEGEEVIDRPLNVLVVGSDSREGLDPAQRDELSTGDFDGERTDTILLAQVRRDGVAILSFPRDLRVEIPDHGTGRINAALAVGGPNAVVGAVEDLVGIEIDHYVEVAIPSFLEIVEAADGVELCLDEPLRNRESGADFDAGCHRMDGPEALAYVRTRSGLRADFDRVERQQRFMVALAERATSVGVLANPVRLQELATTVADGLTVDDGLTIARMVELGQAMRDTLAGGVDSHTVPAYAAKVDGIDFVIPYEPGVEELGRRLSQQEPWPTRPDEDVRAATSLLLLGTDDPQEAARIESVLFYGGWSPEVGGAAPAELTADTEGIQDAPVTVYPTGGDPELAAAVAGVLGADVGEVPSDEQLDLDADVVVVIGASGACGADC